MTGTERSIIPRRDLLLDFDHHATSGADADQHADSGCRSKRSTKGVNFQPASL
jgi:hypothetical protein